jgi:hypothetical protein
MLTLPLFSMGNDDGLGGMWASAGVITATSRATRDFFSSLSLKSNPMRYRLRSLLVLMAACPPLVALAWHDASGALPAMLWLAVSTVIVPLAAHAMRAPCAGLGERGFDE